MTIKREAFLKALNSVTPGLAASGKEMLEQSACLIFRKGQVCSFNDEVSAKAPSGLDPSFEAAVPSAKLQEELAKWNESEFEVTPSDSKLTFTGKGGRKAWVRLEKEILLPVDKVEEPGKWKRLPDNFAEAVGVVKEVASQPGPSSKWERTCVHVHPEWVEAMDPRQVCRWKLKTGVDKPVLIKQKAIQSVTTAGANRFSETAGWIHFKNDDGLILSCRRYADTSGFPNTETALAVKECREAKLPSGLIEEADRAAVFSAENDVNRVLVELAPGKARVSAGGVTGGYEGKWFKVNWDGAKLMFLIAPAIFSDIVRKHPVVQIGIGADAKGKYEKGAPANRMRAEGEGYVYVTALGKVEPDRK